MKLWRTDLVCDLAELDSSHAAQCIKEVVPGQPSSLCVTTGMLQPIAYIVKRAEHDIECPTVPCAGALLGLHPEWH